MEIGGLGASNFAMPLLEQRTPSRPREIRSPEPESEIRLGTLLAEAASWLLSTRVRSRLGWMGLALLYVLATIQFVGAYLFLEWPWVNLQLWEDGSERLPFQTRLLLAPLYRYVDHASWSVAYAWRLGRNQYFFPHGVSAGMVLEFCIGILCVLVSGWVVLRIYDAASRIHLLRPLVYPIFLGLCVLAYVLHTVQNFRYVYDMPSLAAFAVGFYLIYFRKPVIWFVLLFAVATLNRETTLLLLPFWAISQALGAEGRVRWRTLLSRRVLFIVLPLAVYWAAWHHIVFSLFGANPSEYYPRLLFNLHCFLRLRYWPQLASAFGFLWPFLIIYRNQVRDVQLHAWLLVLPVWYAFMMQWAIVTETRVFGELLPFLAPVAAIIAEEVLVSKVLRQIVRQDDQDEVIAVSRSQEPRAA
jgi:hypothetical protein